MKKQHFGDGKEAAIQTREIMTGIGRGTPMRRKSTPLSHAQGKVSRPIFEFVYIIDDVVPKTHDFSEVKTKDEQSDIELKPEIDKLKFKRNVKQKYDCKLNKEKEQERKQSDQKSRKFTKWFVDDVNENGKYEFKNLNKKEKM